MLAVVIIDMDTVSDTPDMIIKFIFIKIRTAANKIERNTSMLYAVDVDDEMLHI